MIGECEKAIDWSNKMVKEWLETGMFKDDPDRSDKADTVVSELADLSITLSHSRHISYDKAAELSLNVERLEDLGQEVQDAVLSVHHACGLTVSATPAFKIIESHLGVGFISSANLVFAPQPPQAAAIAPPVPAPSEPEPPAQPQAP